MSKPMISVIIPVYNPGDCFSRCIKTILTQSYINIEIILVDDGSNDGSEKVCDQYALEDDRVTVIHQDNYGVSHARNTGINIAKGDYYCFIDSDDYIEDHLFEKLLPLMEMNIYDVINYDYCVTYIDHEVVAMMPSDLYGEKDRLQAQKIVTLYQPFVWNKLFSKRIQKTGIRFNEEISRGEDTLYVQIAVESSNRVFFSNGMYYHYVQTQQSACRGTFRTSQLSAIKLIPEYKTLFGEEKELLNLNLIRLEKIFMGIYIDMMNNEHDLTDMKKTIITNYNTVYKDIDKSIVSSIDTIKMCLFRFSPWIYYWCWKISNRS